MRVVIAVCLVAGLSACAVRGTGERFMSDQEVEAKDESVCASFGAPKGTQAYVDCRLRLRSDRSQEDLARRRRAMS